VRGRTRLLVLSGLSAWTAVARAQNAAITTSHSSADPDPAAAEPGLEAWALPLESRTDILDHVGRDTPGVLLLDGGLSIHGSSVRETQLLLDGIRVSRLRAPAAMLRGVQVLRAGFGGALADVTGGAVGATTRNAAGTWHGTVDLFRQSKEFPEPDARALSAVAAGPLVKGRLDLLVSAQTDQETFEPRHDPQGFFAATPEVEVRNHRSGVKLAMVPGAGHRIELLGVGSFRRQDNTTTLGYNPEAQPRLEEGYGLGAIRWRALFGNRWLVGAHLGLEGTTTREFPRQCLTRPDCDHIPLVMAGGATAGNFDRRFQQDERALDSAVDAQLTLPARANWQSSLRIGSRLRNATLDRERLIPGGQLNVFVFNGPVLAPEARITYYANDPRVAPPEFGPIRFRAEQLQALQFVEWPMRVFSRLHLQPGLGLVTARASGGEHSFAASALTSHLGISYEASRALGIWLRASTHRRVDGDLRPPAELAAPTQVSRRCRYDAISNGFESDCRFSGGEPVTVGLPCGANGLNEEGTPCRQPLALPHSWEHTAGVSGDLPGGFRLALDGVYRRTYGNWVRFETNRIWTVIGQNAAFEGFRTGEQELAFDVSAPAGVNRRHRALTTSLERPGAAGALSLDHTYSRTRITRHPLQQLTLVDDDHGRHFIHLQAVWNLWGHGSISARYLYAQGVPLVPLFFNSVLGTWERYRTSGPGGGAREPGELSSRQPSVNELSLQLRLSLRRLVGVDAQAYLDAMNVFPSDKPPSVEQRTGIFFGTRIGFPPERWYRIGLQAGF
jgi:hypothetical protein